MIRFGGSYNLRESEGKHPHAQKVNLNDNCANEATGQCINCSVFFLDDTESNFQVTKNATGEELIEKVFDFLELVECDYFGLQYVCVTGSNTVRLKWLDRKKSIKRQMVCAPYHLFFRLKFYVNDPTRLTDEYTRYLLYLQIRKDLLDGRLLCNEELASILGSFAVQAEFGDYASDDNSYLKVLRLLPSQPTSLLRRIRELHALRLGQTPAEAQLNFLQKAKCLDFYGFDLYEAKDGCDRAITIGVNSNGVSVFDQGTRVHTFPWSAIIKLSFKRKNFYLQIVTADENADRMDTELSFNAISALNCKMLWKACIEHHSFFRLLAPPTSSSRSLFHLGSRFRYSGRTMLQTMEESRKRSNATNRRRPFQRPDTDQKPPIPPQTIDSNRTVSNVDASKHGSVSSIARSPSISSNSITSSTQKANNHQGNKDTTPKNNDNVAVSSSKQHPIRRRTSSLVRATLLRRKISQINTSATSFLSSIFTNSPNNNSSVSPSLSLQETNSTTECSQPDSTKLSTSKASSSTGSEIPPDPKTDSTSSDELKVEIVGLVDSDEEQAIDDEQTIRGGDQTVQEIEEVSDSSEGSSEDESESATPSKKPQRHSVIYKVPSSVLQQPPLEYHPQSNRSRNSATTSNSALTTSLQSLSLDKPVHSTEGALTDDEGGSNTIRRSWNAVPSMIPPQQLGHVRQQFKFTNSPSPYDSASLILKNSLASSGRIRNTVYSMSDDEGSGRNRWYPFRNGHLDEGRNDLNQADYRQRNNVVPITPNTHRRSQQQLLANGSPYSAYAVDPFLNGSGSSSIISNNNNSVSLSNGNYNRPPIPLNHHTHTSDQQQSNGTIRRPNAYVNMSGTDFPASINVANIYAHSPSSFTNRRSLNGAGGGYIEQPSPNTPSTNGSARIVSAPNGVTASYNANGGRLNGSMTDLLNGTNASNAHYAKRVNLNQQPQRPPSTSPSNSLNGEEASVVVEIQPDSQGRFGFNITGGVDCSHPVIISRIIANSAADRCYPRLNEGDQILKINGQNIGQWSYGNVVNYIRSLRNNYGEMTLTIKPNVYRCVGLDEPEDQNILPEIPHVDETVPRSDKLAQSLVLLKESIDTDAIVKQFEQLYRKKPGLSMEQSQLASNVRKNRYRDVRPYDATRVILRKAPSGDYINANQVNMEIPSGIINSYIATQGPLSNTTPDFWYMVWESGSTNIIMLTTLVEKGRQKCHQYWPDVKEILEFGQLAIMNLSERSERYCYYRELSIRNKMTREERRVTQIQYTSWPDHGVPVNGKHFIDFVGEVRRARSGSLDPIIVHCSAGIGRTGVLILMETAACLIESNEPVYPLDIVKIMRDQRPMMIQTTEQFIFTCQCILKAYGDGIIKPLAEYTKSSR